MSYDEYLSWIAFRKKRGSLHPGMRMEHAGAMVTCMLANVYRKQHANGRNVWEFMPHMDEPEISLEQAMESWS